MNEYSVLSKKGMKEEKEQGTVVGTKQQRNKKGRANVDRGPVGGAKKEEMWNGESRDLRGNV